MFIGGVVDSCYKWLRTHGISILPDWDECCDVWLWGKYTFNETIFCLSLFIPGCEQGAISYLFSVCVCQCVCNIRRFYWLRELHAADFHKPGIYGSEGAWANAWDVFRRLPSWGGRGPRAAVDFVVCFGWGGFFFFLLPTHTACCKYEAALPHLRLY